MSIYKITSISFEEFCEYDRKYSNTVFTTREWIDFLKQNQKAKPIFLAISDSTDTIIGIFVSLIIKKAFVKVMGSPFEGWLTPDMGFININNLDYHEAIKAIIQYSFNILKCSFVQICDKKISNDLLDIKHRVDYTRLLTIDLDDSLEDILNKFTKNGRRDVRASMRKEINVVQVPFDKKFAEIYYDQLIDVFEKQKLKPNYSKEKIIDIAEAFKNSPEKVLALEAIDKEGNIIATVFSLGYKDWAYYVGAASYREYQKNLPNEALFWEFVKFWKEKGIKKLDLMGFRQYKMKYNPTISEQPRFMFAKHSYLFILKKIAYRVVKIIRKIRGFFKRH